MRSLLFGVSICFLFCCAAAAPYEIRHVEPLNWWVGMKNPELQVMVHGERIAELDVATEYPGVRVIRTERTGNPNYLFVDLTISPETKPGVCALLFKQHDQVVARQEYKLEARRAGSAERRGFDARDAIYLITPDRFANGDVTNDSHPGLAERADRTKPTGRHGGDIAGIRQHLDYIAGLGFTMIWPTPLLENNQPEYSYHGYAITDNYHVDARFGSNEDYRDCVREAKARGIGVIQDIVLNHIGTGHWWMRDLPAADWLNYQTHPVFTNNQHTVIPDIHAAPEDRERFVNGWFDTSMPDLNQRNPFVARYLIQNTIWWIEYADLSGVREDTFSYADKDFLKAWCSAVLNEYPNFNIVGEEMDDEPYLVAYWQRGACNRDGYDSGLPSITDFPVVDRLPQVLNAEESPTSGLVQLYNVIAQDCLYGNPMGLLVFPDNHDRPRIFSVLHESQDLLRTTLLFDATTRGIPQVYYGTEVLLKSPINRDDGLLRGDMPGGWPGDAVNAFAGAGLASEQVATQDFVRRLFRWRKSSKAVTTGALTHYVPENGYYVYFRHAGPDRVMVVINKNRADGELDLTRFSELIQGAVSGKNVMTDATIDLRSPLKLKALESVAIEFTARE